jgi:hypothetical protein
MTSPYARPLMRLAGIWQPFASRLFNGGVSSLKGKPSTRERKDPMSSYWYYWLKPNGMVHEADCGHFKPDNLNWYRSSDAVPLPGEVVDWLVEHDERLWAAGVDPALRVVCEDCVRRHRRPTQ